MIALRSTPWHTARWRWPFVVAVATVVALFFMSIGVGQAHAWSTSQTAKAVCDGTVKVNATFTNTEPVGSGLDMVVTATVGTLSGGAKTVKVGETESFTIDLGVYTTSGGTVTFALKWVDRSGTDTRTATLRVAQLCADQPWPTRRHDRLG
jgi:enoyl reductase-like protein